MPGVFSKDARPARPGAYFDWEAQPVENVLPNIGSIVFLPFTHDWGPINTTVSCVSFADWQSKFGPSTDTAGYAAVKQCFKGEGLPGRGGAGIVLAYRMATSAAAKAAITLKNTGVVNALTLTAIYEGEYGENLTVTTQVNALDGTRTDLVLSLSGTVVETFTNTSTDITGMAAIINAQSKWVTATELVTTTALASVSNQALSGANDGSSVLVGDWTACMTAAEPQRFSLFAAYALTDSSILAALKTWAVNLNLAGKRFLTIVGGILDEAISDAVTRSETFADADFVNVGVGGVTDAELGILSTAQLVSRVAGIFASRGESQSLTYARMAGTTLWGGPTESAILQAFNGGVVVLSQDSNPDSPVRIEKALTTYTGGDETKPYLIYRNPKFLRTMHGIETDLTEWAAFSAIGQLQVNDPTRAFIVGYAKEVIKLRADKGIVQQGYTVSVDPNPPPTDFDEFVALVYGIAFGRSVEQIFNLVYIS
jgi:Phage tail sheath protein beta-sandwich domain